MRHKWHVRRGYRKIHVAVDIKKKRILWVGAVTTEEVHDCKMLTKLIDITSENNKVNSAIQEICSIVARFKEGLLYNIFGFFHKYDISSASRRTRKKDVLKEAY